MENKDWEDFNGDLNPKEDSFALGDSSPDTGSTDPAELFRDAFFKEKLSDYNPSNHAPDWDKIAASLDAADEAFDHQVRNRINQYHPTYDPQSWSKFTKRFSAHKHLRMQLIMFKLSEAAAILLLILTILHLGQKGKLPFQEPMAEEINVHPEQSTASFLKENQVLLADQAVKHLHTEDHPEYKESGSGFPVKESNSLFRSQGSQKNGIAITMVDFNHGGTLTENTSSPAIPIVKESHTETGSLPANESSVKELLAEKNNSPARNDVHMVDFLAQPESVIKHAHQNAIPTPILVAATERAYVEFGMLAQADYNQLKMPEDRLNSNGEQIVFPLQGITSPGFGAGFTVAIGHPRWALETGVIYNAKSFRPGRGLTIGDEADISKVEYEAMHMQLVSVPLQYRYRFDVKGRLKTYALAGFGLHFIAQSDIDVNVDYYFPSLPEGEDPNNNPSLARTIRQTQRVSEDLRKSAPFSTNSYISANLGLGVEYSIVERKTLFLQTAYQYQIPNLRFSNHNGKHVLSLSLQAGVRTPLGF